MDVGDLIASPPKLHIQQGELIGDWRLADEELLFIDRRLAPGMRTIETGAGVSTVLFAVRGTRHTCIVPDSGLVGRIKAWCDENGVSHEGVSFVVDRSESALPQLKGSQYDLALIDGRHSFPTPFIDWFFLSQMLSPGGIVIVDDLHIWTCDLLRRFLLSASGWHVAEETLRAAAFVKDGECAHEEQWQHQPFVRSRSRQTSAAGLIGYMMHLVRHGKFSLLGQACAAGARKPGRVVRRLLGRK